MVDQFFVNRVIVMHTNLLFFYVRALSKTSEDDHRGLRLKSLPQN